LKELIKHDDMPVLFSILRVVKERKLEFNVDRTVGNKRNSLPSIFDRSIRSNKSEASSRFKEMIDGDIPQTAENISKLAEKSVNTDSIGVKYSDLSEVDKKGMEYTSKKKRERARKYDKVNKVVKQDTTTKVESASVNAPKDNVSPIQPSQQL